MSELAQTCGGKVSKECVFDSLCVIVFISLMAIYLIAIDIVKHYVTGF